MKSHTLNHLLTSEISSSNKNSTCQTIYQFRNLPIQQTFHTPNHLITYEIYPFNENSTWPTIYLLLKSTHPTEILLIQLFSIFSHHGFFSPNKIYASYRCMKDCIFTSLLYRKTTIIHASHNQTIRLLILHHVIKALDHSHTM